MSIRFTDKLEEANVITHAGNFHADDIFSLVILEKKLGKLIVFRSKEHTIDNRRLKRNAIVFDIGHGEFDHHQRGGNGYHDIEDEDVSCKPIPYAAFGLLWKRFGREICDIYTAKDQTLTNKLWKDIEYNLVIGIDAIDNGIFPFTPGDYEIYSATGLPNLISLLNPIEENETNYQKAMKEAFGLAKFIFYTKIRLSLQKYSSVLYSKQKEYYFIIKPEEIFTKVLAKLFSTHKFENTNMCKMILNDSQLNDTQIPSRTTIPASSFGNLWNKSGMDYCYSLSHDARSAAYIWKYVRSQLVLGIDAMANGIKAVSKPQHMNYNLLSIYEFIQDFNILISSSEEYHFFNNKAFEIAELLVNRLIKKALRRTKDRAYVESKIIEAATLEENRKFPKHILVLDRHAHWSDWLVRIPEGKEIWFVISPSNRGGYEIHPVPNKYNKNGYRKGFPMKWHGLKDEELRRVSKVSTATFIHDKKGFIGGAEDLTGAIKLCERSFGHNENIKISTYNSISKPTTCCCAR